MGASVIHPLGLIMTLLFFGFWIFIIYAVFQLLSHAKAIRQALNRLEIKLDKPREDVDNNRIKPS
ncbi:hypothetical protein WMW72_07800 [Paenibacillus filicis]|uniref:CcmD family protein n=1 Tax=Paenibacillus filicis TaxID=669464 RepID=A0ABU9DG21_9BACL